MVAIIAICFVVSVLIVSAALLLVNFPFVERIREGLHCSSGLARSAGIIQLFAAGCLIVPELRIWGIAAAAGVITAGVVILLYNKRFLWVLPALLLLAALIPVAMAR